MKHVYSRKEITHILFHRPTGLETARTPTGNFSWKYFPELNIGIVYSYSSELAKVDFNRSIVYFRRGSYSSTTSKHQSDFGYAIPGYFTVFYYNNWWDWDDLDKWCLQSVEYAKKSKETLNSGTKHFSEPGIAQKEASYLEHMLTKIDRLDLYQKYMPEVLKWQWTKEDLLKYKIKSWTRDNEMLGSYDKKKKYYNDPTLKALVEEKYKSNQFDKEEKARQRALLLQQQEQEKLQKWLDGEYYGNLYNVPIHLRIVNTGSDEVKENSYVETTLGVKVPITHCKLLYKKFRQCIETNTEWETNGHSIHIGNYKVQKIQQRLRNKYPNILEWSILAGCHLLFQTEIEKFVNDNNLDWND